MADLGQLARRANTACPPRPSPEPPGDDDPDDDALALCYGRHADDHRQPHRQAVRGPDPGRHDQGDRPAPDQSHAGRVRPDDLRPGVHEHGRLQEPDHLHRRRQGHPALPRLPDRAARRAERLPRDRLPDSRSASCRRQKQLDEWTHADHAAHDAAREHREADGGLPARRAPDGGVHQHRRRALDLLSRRQGDLLARVAPAADHPADRQGAEHRGLCLPPHASAARSSSPTTT